MSELQNDEHRTSVTLLGRLRSNDPKAWERLSELYGPLVYSWARRAGLQPEDAADVTQTVFQSVFTGFVHFRKDRPSDRFRDWLWTITRHRVIDYIRKLRSAAIGTGGSDAQVRWQQFPEDLFPEEPDSSAEASETILLVRRALELVRAEFEKKTWLACLRTTIDGVSAADAAKELEMTVGAVYVARSRVLKRLRQELESIVAIPQDQLPPLEE